MSNNKRYIRPEQINPHLSEAYKIFLSKQVLNYQEGSPASEKAWKEYVACKYNMEYIEDDSKTSKPKADKLIAAHYTDTYDHLEEVKTSIPGLHLVRWKSDDDDLLSSKDRDFLNKAYRKGQDQWKNKGRD